MLSSPCSSPDHGGQRPALYAVPPRCLSPYQRAVVFIDGMTFKILSDYYRQEHARQSRLSFPGLDKLVSWYLEDVLHQPVRVTERHLFIGVRPSPYSVSGEATVPPAFRETLMLSEVILHSLPLRTRHEKGIDTLLTMELLEKAIHNEIDIAVILATDGDFAPLMRKVRSLGIAVLLLGFHLPSNPRQPVFLSAALTDSVTWHLDVSDLIESRAPKDRSLVDGLFWSPPASGRSLKAHALRSASPG